MPETNDRPIPVKLVYDALNHDYVVRSIVDQFVSRANHGFSKYHVSMERSREPIDQWIQHAIEEAMDFILYLNKLKMLVTKYDIRPDASLIPRAAQEKVQEPQRELPGLDDASSEGPGRYP